MAQRSDHEVVEDFEQRARAILGSGPSTAADAADGRVAIRLRNREKVIEALVELVTEGKAATIDEIVERSGVARRTIFRQFTDLPDLWLAGMRTVMTRAAPLGILQDRGVGPLQHRIDAFVDARLRTLALMYPFRAGMNSRLSEFDVVKAGVKAAADMILDQISNQFAEEFAMLPTGEAERLVDAIYVVSSYESYDILVGQLGRPVAAVRATWVSAVSRLLEV